MCFPNEKNGLRDDRIENALKEDQGEDEGELVIRSVVSFHSIEGRQSKARLFSSFGNGKTGLTSILERSQRADKQ